MSVLVLREKGLPAGRQGKTLEKNFEKIEIDRMIYFL